MCNDSNITDDIMARYITFLLSGHTINRINIQAATIEGYMREVNRHYESHNLRKPFDKKAKTSTAARLLRDQEKAEKDPARREPLPHNALVKMMELGQEEPLGFRGVVWDIVGLGRYGGFRCQEFAMDNPHDIKYYTMPNGAVVTRAFVVRNIRFRDGARSEIRDIFGNRDRIEETGQEYDVQKNRRNGQVIWCRRVREHAAFCPVELALRLVWRAETLGQGREDPLCVYKDGRGLKKYLTGHDVTEYLRFCVRLTNPSISDEELKLISTHSIRVTACVLLAEAGKDGWYIKLRLRWLSDCYEIYIRNTSRIAEMHNIALSDAHDKMSALGGLEAPDLIEENGVLDRVPYEIEDED